MTYRSPFPLLALSGFLSFLVVTPSATAQSTPSPVSFVTTQGIPVSGIPLDYVASGDLNGDGRADFVAGYAGPTALLNNGDGTYTSKLITSDFVSGLALSDVNRDGILDVIYSETNNSQVAFFVARGIGDGTFASPDKYVVAAGDLSSAIAVFDSDGDGWPDIAVSYGPTSGGSTSGLISVYQNQKNGKFKGTSQNRVGELPRSIVSADFNGDGIPDLAVGNAFSNNISILWGQGAGVFVPGGTYPTGVVPTSIAVADINADGYPDLAVASSSGVTILLGNASGTFTAGTPINEPATSVVLSDLNSDGKIDLAISVNLNASTGTGSGEISHVSIYWGNGSGAFPTHKVFSAGQFPFALLATDINGDGHVDLVLGDSSLFFLYGDGYGQFEAAPVQLSSFATGMTSGDFNRDGTPDVAVVNTPLCAAPCTGTVTLMMGTGKNYLGPSVKYPIGMHGAGIASGDVNGDSIADLVVTNNTDGDTYDLAVLLGNGDGSFKPASNQHLGALSADVVVADVNNDHKLDLVTVAGIALGNGNGTFGALIPYPAIPSAVGSHVAVADFDKDGFLDIALATTNAPNVIGGGDAVAVLKGNGTGNFTYQTGASGFLEGDASIKAIATGDLTGDGSSDIAVTGDFTQGNSEGYVSVIVNNNDGTFSSPGPEFFSNNTYLFTAWPGGSTGGAISLVDLNGDGLLDIAVATDSSYISGSHPDSVSVLLNKGAGAFTFPVSFLALSGPTQSMVVADFNKDGQKDIAVTSQLGVSLLFGRGVLSFSPASLSWAKVSIGQTGAPKTVTVTNNSNQAIALKAAVGGVEAAEFRIYTNTCNATIAGHATCSVTVAFRPTATGKQDAATLSLAQAGLALGGVSLTGIGAP